MGSLTWTCSTWKRTSQMSWWGVPGANRPELRAPSRQRKGPGPGGRWPPNRSSMGMTPRLQCTDNSTITLYNKWVSGADGSNTTAAPLIKICLCYFINSLHETEIMSKILLLKLLMRWACKFNKKNYIGLLSFTGVLIVCVFCWSIHRETRVA